MNTSYLPVYRPTQAPPSHRPSSPMGACRGCANASAVAEDGWSCRLLDEPANVDDGEVATVEATRAAWEIDEPVHCPGWTECRIEVCTFHGYPFPADDCCPGCERDAIMENER